MNADPVFYYPEWKQAALDALVAQYSNIRQRIEAYERCKLPCEGLRRQEVATLEALRTIDRMDQPIGKGSTVPYHDRIGEPMP